MWHHGALPAVISKVGSHALHGVFHSNLGEVQGVRIPGMWLAIVAAGRGLSRTAKHYQGNDGPAPDAGNFGPKGVGEALKAEEAAEKMPGNPRKYPKSESE